MQPGAVRAVRVGVVDEVALTGAEAAGGEPYSVSR
jgi:hypothetical protein